MAGETFSAIGYNAKKLAIVLNRSDSAGGFDKADVETALGAPIDFEVISDGRLVIAANNEGIPFVTSTPDAPISGDVRRIADALVARLAERSPALARR